MFQKWRRSCTTKRVQRHQTWSKVQVADVEEAPPEAAAVNYMILGQLPWGDASLNAPAAGLVPCTPHQHHHGIIAPMARRNVSSQSLTHNRDLYEISTQHFFLIWAHDSRCTCQSKKMQIICLVISDEVILKTADNGIASSELRLVSLIWSVSLIFCQSKADKFQSM